MPERGLSIRYLGDADSVKRALKEIANGNSQLRKEVKGVHDEVGTLKTGAVTAAKAIAGSYAAIKIKDFLKDSVNRASDLNEEISKSRAVFGSSAKSILSFSETSTKSLGISRVAAIQASATFGNLFTALKIGQPESAKMSTSLVKLAGDLASFNNVDPTEALDALRSGLVGETEPLKRFGVNLNEATLKTKAFELGLITSTKEALDPATKAQASYALILEQTTTAQGDAARTIGGLAGQKRVLAAQVDDLKTKIGDKLLPATLQLTKAANENLGPAVASTTDFLKDHKTIIEVTAAAYGVKLVAGLAASVREMLLAEGAALRLGRALRGTLIIGTISATVDKYRDAKDAAVAANEAAILGARDVDVALHKQIASQEKLIQNLRFSTKTLRGDLTLGIWGDSTIEAKLKAQATLLDARKRISDLAAKAERERIAQVEAAENAQTESLRNIAVAAGESAADQVKASGLSIEALQEVQKEAEQFRAAMSNSFQASTSLVGAFGSQTEVTKRQVLEFFKSQVAAAREWSTNLIALAKAGLDQGLLKEVAEAGPKAAPLIKALLEAVKSGNLESINQAQIDLRAIMNDTVNVVAGAAGPGFLAGKAVGTEISNGIFSGISVRERRKGGPQFFHSGGLVRHAGGIIPRMHSGGLRSDERVVIAQAGEFMMRRKAVDRLGVNLLDRLNNGESLVGPTGGYGASSRPSSIRVEVPVILDGEVIARVIAPDIREELLRRFGGFGPIFEGHA